MKTLYQSKYVNTSAKLSELIKSGPQKYTHVYNQNMTTHHIAKVPDILIKLAKKCPDAEVLTYNDGTLGINVNNKKWVMELFARGEDGKSYAKTLNEEVWRYISLALEIYAYAGWLDPIND